MQWKTLLPYSKLCITRPRTEPSAASQFEYEKELEKLQHAALDRLHSEKVADDERSVYSLYSRAPGKDGKINMVVAVLHCPVLVSKKGQRALWGRVTMDLIFFLVIMTTVGVFYGYWPFFFFWLLHYIRYKNGFTLNSIISALWINQTVQVVGRQGTCWFG